jgi:hypothetical protein
MLLCQDSQACHDFFLRPPSRFTASCWQCRQSAPSSKAVKPGFLSWRLDAALNPKWSQSIMIIIKPQNPVFSEPKKSPITEAFVFVGGIFATTEDTRRNSSISPVRHLQRDTDCQIVCQETRDGAEPTTFVVVL